MAQKKVTLDEWQARKVVELLTAEIERCAGIAALRHTDEDTRYHNHETMVTLAHIRADLIDDEQVERMKNRTWMKSGAAFYCSACGHAEVDMGEAVLHECDTVSA